MRRNRGPIESEEAVAERLVDAMLRRWPDAATHREPLQSLLVQPLRDTEQDIYTHSDRPDVPLFRLVHEGAWDLMDGWAVDVDPLSGGPRDDDLVIEAPGTTRLPPGRWRIRR